MTATPPDPKDVALAILTNMIRLMGAELVAGRHRDDVAILERAVREKLAATTVPVSASQSAEAGLEIATRCIEQALAQIHAQADEAHAAEVEQAKDEASATAAEHPKPTLQ